MRTGTQTHTYHGTEIWIRWFELKPLMMGHRRFVANYTLGSKVSTVLTHQTDGPAFVSSKTAANAALDRAMLAIDAAIAARLAGNAP